MNKLEEEQSNTNEQHGVQTRRRRKMSERDLLTAEIDSSPSLSGTLGKRSEPTMDDSFNLSNQDIAHMFSIFVSDINSQVIADQGLEPALDISQRDWDSTSDTKALKRVNSSRVSNRKPLKKSKDPNNKPEGRKLEVINEELNKENSVNGATSCKVQHTDSLEGKDSELVETLSPVVQGVDRPQQNQSDRQPRHNIDYNTNGNGHQEEKNQDIRDDTPLGNIIWMIY